MKMTEELRVENMARLRDEFGSVTALAARLERSDSQVSQWINASINSGTGQPRSMKAKTARWIEETAGKPRGWLDQDHSTGLSPSPNTSVIGNQAEWQATPIPDIKSMIRRATPRSAEALKRIAEAHATGKLTEADIQLLESIAQRLYKD